MKFSIKTTDGDRFPVSADSEADARRQVSEKTNASISKIKPVAEDKKVGR